MSPEPAATDPAGKEKEFRILALSGGGYLGVFTAALLADLEEKVGEPLGRRFDLIAGTSVGGILAVALAFELPMREILGLFLDRGDQVFSSRALPKGAVSRLIDLTRSVMGPKYDGMALREALTEYLGDAKLGKALHHVVIPSVNVTRSHTKVFKTPHGPASKGDERVLAVDVAMATSAAPAYFPSVEINGELFADGGMFAVAPDQVALHEAEHFMGVDPDHVRMLSIGTGTSSSCCGSGSSGSLAGGAISTSTCGTNSGRRASKAHRNSPRRSSCEASRWTSAPTSTPSAQRSTTS